MTDKEKIMKQVQMYRFALIDASLFLDTHPSDKEALKYFRRIKELFEKALEEYEKKYGSINISAGIRNDKWEWATTPFPWESED